MNPTADPSAGHTSLRLVEHICIGSVVLIAGVILLAWMFPAFASFLPHGWDLMKVNTAIGMLLAAAGLWTVGAMPSLHTSASQALAAALSLLAVLILLEHLAGIRLHMDTWLAADAASPEPGLTSAQTAVGLLLLGLAILCTTRRAGVVSMVADALAFALVGFLLVLLAGYLYGASRLVGESSLIRVSPQTLVCFALLVCIAVSRRVVYGGFSPLLTQSRIGRVVLITAPLMIGLIYATGFFYIYVRQNAYLNRSDGVALSVSALSMVVLYVILLMATRINRLEQNVRGLLQKRSEAQLQESEQRYMEAVEQSISGFVVRRADGQLILVNEAYRKMTGYSREELLTLKARDLVVDQGVIERVQRLQAGESAHIETFLKRKDGSLLEVEYVTQHLKNGNFQSFLLDISYRKNIQKARDESERRYVELVDQALEGIMVRKPGGDIVFVNETFCRMLHYHRDELLHLNIRDIVHPDDAETVQQIQRLGHGGHLRLQKRMLRKDREVVYADVSAKRLRNGDIQTTVQDITEQHAAEERERIYTEELRQMSRRLSEAQETERRAIARELHDEVGQSLTATRINLRDLEQEAVGGPFAERLTAASSIIAELLSKVRQMSLDLHPSVLDDLGLAPALRWCVRTRITGSKLEVVLDMPEELPRFDGMAEITLFRVVQEALSNVLRHAEARHVTVKLRHASGRLDLSVKDDGRGFDTAAARRHAISGKSLGLLGMEERVRLAGGEIMFESVPGKGTELRVSLPASLRQE
jgi:PAS domain S-box-containing protein